MQATDSTIALPKPAIFFNERFIINHQSWLLDTRKDTIEKKVSIYFLVIKTLTIDDVGEGVVVEGHRISGDTAGCVGFETGDFVNEKKLGELP